MLVRLVEKLARRYGIVPQAPDGPAPRTVGDLLALLKAYDVTTPLYCAPPALLYWPDRGLQVTTVEHHDNVLSLQRDLVAVSEELAKAETRIVALSMGAER